MKKRMISLLLAFVMIAGMIPLSAPVAFAAGSGPIMVPDFNRDGKIDEKDRDRLMAETGILTVWLNDDDDNEGTGEGTKPGDTNSAGHNVPSGEGNDADYADDKVNGRCDLLDFFPISVDVTGVNGWRDFTWGIKSAGDANVNVVFTKLQANEAGDFHTNYYRVNAFDGETPLYEADTVSLDDEVELPEGFLDAEGRGVFLIEGSRIGEGYIVLTGDGDDRGSVSFNMPITVANVEDMYRTINLRQGGVSRSGEPAAREDADSDGRQFVFVHGYNVSHNEARGIAAEFYKKLWQSGSDSMFTAVEWESDESRTEMEHLREDFTFNYYVNVEHAFAAAEEFKNECDRLPGRKYLVGHSLGNMLICSAIQDFGLEYEKYFMLNAAIASEAFDKNAFDSGMVDDYWENHIPESERASHWYEKFDEYAEYRSTLTWKGRFADVKDNVVNLYSPTDEFLANCPDDVNREADEREANETIIEKWTNGGFWAFTEKMKGTEFIDVLNSLMENVYQVGSQINREGGWGINEHYVPGDTGRANTRFTPLMDERMAYDGPFVLPEDQAFALRAKQLADAIPAESYAVGANQVSTLTNKNLESYIGENDYWPSRIEIGTGEDGENIWKHNDVTEIAYYHTHGLFEYMTASPWDRLCEGRSLDGEFEISESGLVRTIKLLRDIKAGSNDVPFRVDDWAYTVILDLNGHSIDVSQAGGSAIVVGNEANLTIIDSSESSCGKITGGTGQALDISDDKLYGGGVLVEGKLTMTGGAVTGNSADVGGGIYVVAGGELTVGGTAKIYGNFSGDGTVADNLFLENNKYITVCTGSDGLKEDAKIGISQNGTGRFTTNGTEADVNYFFSDAEGKIIRHETDGTDHLELDEAPDIRMTVTLDQQGGSGGSTTAEARYAYAMPEIAVPTKTGYTFDGYYDASGKAYYNASGESVRRCDRQEDFTLYAHWKFGTYNIIYKDKYGEIFTGVHEIGHPITHTYGSVTTLKEAGKVDHTFAGWFKEPDCSGSPVTSVTADCTEDSTLYAKWICHPESNHTDANEDNLWDECGAIADETIPAYTGISLTLGSDICINFYMHLPDDALENGILFVIGNRTVEGITAKRNESNGRYYFSCPLNALEMAETVTASFTYARADSILPDAHDYKQTYSVENYVETILGGDYTPEMQALARKISNYGYYAQLYLESIHKNVTIGGADGYVQMSRYALDDIDVNEAKKLTDNFIAPEDTTNLTFEGRTVSFDSATALNFYVIAKDGKAPKASCDKGKTVEVKLYKGNTYIVSVKNITATELADTFTVTVGEGADSMTIKGSALDYCAAVIRAHDVDDPTEKDTLAINAMAAFYEYHKAAKAYAAN